MTPLEQLAAWASGVAPVDISAAQVELARRRVLDTLGLIAAVSAEPVAHAVLTWAQANAGAPSATVLPDGAQTSPATAALVHGTLAHARDFDDTFPDSVVHPGSVVIPAALSIGETTDAGFADVATAITVGYEVAARLGQVAGRAFHARGFHATGVVGPMAAAATAGHLLKLDRNAMADALGLATSMSGGLMAFLADGAWSKWLHTGWSAHGGIIAAELAARGFRGPRHALDDKAGLYGAFIGLPVPDLARLTDKLGARWPGDTARPKIYPCAHVIEPYLDAVLGLRAQYPGGAGIASIRCALAPWAIPIVAEPRATKIAPRSDLDAIASLPFMLAAALCDGKVDLDTLRPDALARADIRALAARIACDADDTLGKGFDGYLTVHPEAGSSVRCPVGLLPVDAQRVRSKFRANAARLYGAPQAAAIETAVLDGEPPCRALMRMASRTRA